MVTLTLAAGPIVNPHRPLCFRPRKFASRFLTTFKALALLPCIFFVSVCGLGWRALNANSPDRPNVLFILADDLGCHQIGAYGADFYETPNIDRLASDGMKFTSGYAACPVCSPTRASIMTGKYPARLHLTDFIPGGDRAGAKQKLRNPNWTKHLPLSEHTIAEELRAKGYATGHFGKWHLNKDKSYRPGRPGDPGSQGFDVVLTTHKPGAGPKSRYPDDAHHVREITEQAIAFMRSQRESPFFCYVAHNSIHRPLAEREEQIRKYQQKSGSDRKDHHPTVAAMVQTLDESVGKLVDALDQLKLTENTMVVFVSDNGCMWGPKELKPLRGGKAELYEGGIRVPMIVRWPRRVEAGSICDVPATTVDFFPTLAVAAGSEYEDPAIDGESLLPLLDKSGDLKRDAIFWHYPHYHKLSMAPGGAIRQGNYKLIEWFEQSVEGFDTEGAVELYDLQTDIHEQHDLAQQKPELATRLYQRLKQWRTQTNAQMMPRNLASD